MPRKVTPMKYRGFYCPAELWQQMQEVAIEYDESDSEFIRTSVRKRIEQINNCGYDNITGKKPDSTHKNNTADTAAMAKMCTERVNELREDKQTVKAANKMVQSFMKGGK